MTITIIVVFDERFFQWVFSLDFKQFKEGAITTFSGNAFQESIILKLKLFDRTLSIGCFLASLSWCPLDAVYVETVNNFSFSI